MSYRDRTATDPVFPNESDDVAEGLAAFISEASMTRPPVESAKNPLWQFPKEPLRPASAVSGPTIRRPSVYGYYASLAAAILIAVIAGRGGAGSSPEVVRSQTPRAPSPIVVAPARKSLPDESSPPAQLTASRELLPSTWPRMARVVSTAPLEEC